MGSRMMQKGYERMRERELLEQIFRLPRKYRVPIYLYYYEEYSVADIGDMLGKILPPFRPGFPEQGKN